MSTSPLPSIRKELQELFRHCERLVASALAPNHSPFSDDERKMICYYANEVAKIADSQVPQVSKQLNSENNLKPGMTTGGHETDLQELSVQAQAEHHGWGWWIAGKRT